MDLGTSALLVRDMPVGRLTAALPDRYYETDDPIDARMAFSPALGPDTAVTSRTRREDRGVGQPSRSGRLWAGGQLRNEALATPLVIQAPRF